MKNPNMDVYTKASELMKKHFDAVTVIDSQSQSMVDEPTSYGEPPPYGSNNSFMKQYQS